MKIIALEEHFFTHDYLDHLRSRREYPRLETVEDEKHNKVERMARSPSFSTVKITRQFHKLLDISDGRIREMDDAGIDMQVLSLSGPGTDELEPVSGTEMAKKVNDELAKAVSKHPDRFAGLASICPADPEGAARELKRAVKELGLKGANVNSHGRGEYLDDPKYRVIFETAEKLNVPIYLHPKEPHPDMMKAFAGYPLLSAATWGYVADTGLHALRLIASGLFDAYPNLKIVLGHLGETIPFYMWRIDNRWTASPSKKKAKNKPGDYFKKNFFVTTSGMFWEPAFLCTYMALGADRIMFAEDYPYESSEMAMKFVENLPICDADKEKVCHLNAEKLLSL